MGTGSHTDFKKLFVIYTLNASGIAVIISLVIDVYLFRKVSEALSILPQTQSAHLLGLFYVGLLMLVPPLIFLGVLALTAIKFGKQLADWYRPPVQELRRAVEKIKRQDLDFFILYDGKDEIGDLCRAFNELRSQLQASLSREWTKEEEAREMVAALSHDLRTPVTILQGYIEAIVSTEPEKRLQRMARYLPALEGNVQRMTRLLDDMLMISSIEQSGFVLQPETINLEQVLQDKVAAYTLRCAEHAITFHYETCLLPELEQTVRLDYHHIEQVLDNLFENALRFTPEKGHITLRWVGNTHVHCFSIHDTGEGIASEDLPHIFEKYYSRSSKQARKNRVSKKSVGMGLYICKELVRRHGGDISAQNCPDGGCELSFWVSPVAIASMDHSENMSLLTGKTIAASTFKQVSTL